MTGNSTRQGWRQFTARQAQVARLLRQGYTQAQAAQRLGLSLRTVEQHAAEIRKRRGGAASTMVALLAPADRDEHDRLLEERRLHPRVSASLRFEVLSRDNFTCRYCGRRAPDVELHVDHILAWARGGTTDRSNLVTSCVECNLGKRDRALPPVE